MNENKEQQKKEDKDIKTKLQECEKEKEEYLAGWQRARADFLNYKKDEIEKIEEILKYGREEFILKILPILDNFDLAEKKLSEDLKNNDSPEAEQARYGASIKGFFQIKTQILDFLRTQGAEEMKTIGEKFDPNFHEAVEQAAEEGKESGTILEVLQKGYTINGQLLRPAKVKVVR